MARPICCRPGRVQPCHFELEGVGDFSGSFVAVLFAFGVLSAITSALQVLFP